MGEASKKSFWREKKLEFKQKTIKKKSARIMADPAKPRTVATDAETNARTDCVFFLKGMCKNVRRSFVCKKTNCY